MTLCPLCSFELARDRYGTHLVRCVVECATWIGFGPVGAAPAIPAVLVWRSAS